ncbi:MAG: transketolase C-terminal domain-containing protein [Pseudomonadota bacterium]
MRKACLRMVHELARQDQRVIFVGSDLGVGTLEEMRREFPERFFMEGICEQAIIGMAAGLAMDGKHPYIHTIATFLSRRCFEQLALDLCLHNLSVCLLGTGGGMVYTPLGPTHEAIEDLSILRSLPNMTVVAPADAEEMKRAMRASLHHLGPLYIRLAKGGDPVVTTDMPFAIGKAVAIRPGGEVLLVTTGITLQIGLGTADILRARGIETSVLHMPTIKPFDTDGFLAAASPARAIVTLEENTIVGGLGSASAEALAEAGLPPSAAPRRFRRLGIPDVFPDHYGSQASNLARYGLDAESVATTACELLARVAPQ